jgi:hypothetical protein
VVVAQDAQIVLLSSDRGLYLGVGKDYAAGTRMLDMGNLSANQQGWNSRRDTTAQRSDLAFCSRGQSPYNDNTLEEQESFRFAPAAGWYELSTVSSQRKDQQQIQSLRELR